MKPFDCVGTFDESQAALSLAAERTPDSLVVREFLPLLQDTDKTIGKVMKAYQALAIPSAFRMLGMKSALILGYGREGHATERFLAERFPHVLVGTSDKEDGEGYLQKQDKYDIVIKTPVIPKELVSAHYTTATNLFFSEVSREQIIGVTGSKGKSTTSKLIYEMLKQGGAKVRLVGNIGVPALQEILETPVHEDELFVFELSSYQLEDLDVSPHIAVITSLFPEHIDHHGSLEAYYEAKRNIIRFQEADDTFVSAEGFALLDAWADDAFGSVLFPETIPFKISNPSLKGDHNLSNVRLAYTVARMFGVSEVDIQQAVEAFVGLPHRLEPAGTYKGIEFYDDSISTTPQSAIAGILALQNVDTIILGGVDRGYDFAPLEKELRAQGIRNVILFPESGEHMLASEEGFTILHTSSMEEAVQFAYAHTQEGKSCLLSPSAPSYNLFTNFEERGEAFKAAVKKYGTV
jgi:UDP-N-acetylmuramoylalanine--D-glutamate ligase